MKIILFLISIFALLAFSTAGSAVFIDTYGSASSLIDTAGTGSILQSVDSSNPLDIILGGQRELFVKVAQTSNVGTGLRVSIVPSTNTTTTPYGSLSFSIDTNVIGQLILTYDGSDSITGNPCSSSNDQVLLNSTVCDTPNPSLASPGLNVDWSQLDGVSFSLNKLDLACVTLYVRVWTNNGGSASYVFVFNEIVRTRDPKKFYFLPFSQFSGFSSLDLKNVRAISFQFFGTDSIDLNVSPFQIFGYNITKRTTTTGVQSPSSTINFAIRITQLTVQAPGLITNTNYTAIIRDILPSEFSSFAPIPFTVTDLNGVSLPSILNSASGNEALATVNFTHTNGGINLAYSAQTISTYPFCQKTVCNNANISLISNYPSGQIMTSFVRQACIDLQSSPKIETTFTTCPSTFATNPQTVAKVCNIGNGLATSVFFNQSSLENGCTVSSPTAICVNGFCTQSIGNLLAGECSNVTLNFDCSSSASSCNPLTFSSSFFASETCVGSQSNSSLCSFQLNPGSPKIETTFTTCPSTYSTNPQTVAKVCNIGTGTARNTFFNQSSLTNGCTVSSPTAICVNGFCTQSIGNLLAGECSNVTLNFDCSSSSSSCNPLTFSSSLFASETCVGSQSNSSLCSFQLNPGVPQIQTSFPTCPSTYSTNPQTVAKVCNIGTGIARNTFFNQTIISGCTVSSPTAICVNGFCTQSIGNLLAGECSNVTLNFDCSSFSKTCRVHSFSSLFVGSETCVGSQSNSSCSFQSTPSLTFTVVETLANMSAPAKVNEEVTWRINVTNNGPADSESFNITKQIPSFTTPVVAGTGWVCDIPAGTCVTTVPSLAALASFIIPFTVSINSNIPVSTTQVCNSVSISTQNIPNCFAVSSTTSCAPVNPGTPDISVTKAAATTQYTFVIEYSSIGSGEVNNLILHENLQPGWSLSPSSTLGWTCGVNKCQFIVGFAPVGSQGTVNFVVDVDKNAQIGTNGKTKCWENIVSTTFDDEKFDPTKSNNEASTTIGSSCSTCCDQPACPVNVCNVTCPPTEILFKADCPPVNCACKVPEYWCPPCQKNPPPCSCSNCIA